MYTESEAPSRLIETFVFMDLEATGLPPSQPKIAEMCLFAVTRNALENPKYNNSFPKPVPLFPRLVDKLCICIDPEKSFTPIASSVTGLTNEEFSKNKRQPFNVHILQMISAFLSRQQAPICLVAHNGWSYDFPLLKAELSSLGFSGLEEIYCADTIKAMRALDAKDSQLYQFAYQPSPLGSKKNYSLRDLHFKFFKVYPLKSHNAEDDVITLITVFQQRARDLIGWMDSNARPLKTIRAMFKEEKLYDSFSETPEVIQPLLPKGEPERKPAKRSFFSLLEDNDDKPKYSQNILLLFLGLIVIWVALKHPV